MTNKTTGSAKVGLWIGATGANAAGTESIFGGTASGGALTQGVSIPAQSYRDWFGELLMDSTDFLVGGSDTGSALTISAEGEIGLAGVAGGGAFNPATLFSGTAGAFYDISDISTLWKDTAGTIQVTAHGDAVARVDDKSGNGNHLLQSTSSSRPLYQVSGAKKYLLTDGVDDLMRANFAMGSTWDRIMAFQSLAWAAGNEVYFGANSGTAGEVFGSAAGTITMWNGSVVGPAASGLSTSTDYVMTERWGPSPCQLAIDNGSYVSTPSIVGPTPIGFTLASDNGSSISNMEFFGGVMINRALTGGEIASMRTWAGALQGRVL